MFNFLKRKKSIVEKSTVEKSGIFWKNDPEILDNTQWFKIIKDAPFKQGYIYTHRIVIVGGLKQFFKIYVRVDWFKEKKFISCTKEEYEGQLKTGIH